MFEELEDDIIPDEMWRELKKIFDDESEPLDKMQISSSPLSSITCSASDIKSMDSYTPSSSFASNASSTLFGSSKSKRKFKDYTEEKEKITAYKREKRVRKLTNEEQTEFRSLCNRVSADESRKKKDEIIEQLMEENQSLKFENDKLRQSLSEFTGIKLN